MAKRGKKPRANPPSPKTEREEVAPKGRGRPPLSDEERAARAADRKLEWRQVKELPCGPMDLRKQARSYAPAAMAVIHGVLMGAQTSTALRLRAAEVVLAYALAKPIPTVDENESAVKGPVDRLIDALTSTTATPVPTISASREEREVIEMGIASDEDGE